MIRKALIAFAICIFAACATPVSNTNQSLSTYDKHTEYSIEENDHGFSIRVYYSRYEVVESTDVAKACKQQLAAIAWSYAENKRKAIEPVTEQQIRISMDRTILKANTSCQADAVISWKKP